MIMRIKMRRGSRHGWWVGVVGGLYRNRDDGESYSLPLDWDGDDFPLIGMQTPDLPECGT